MRYWIELGFAFDEAYRKGDIRLFKRILDYADWCFHAPRGRKAEDDLASCIHVCLFEHMPQISSDEKIDPCELGLSLLSWDGPTIAHPHVRALHQNLINRPSIPSKAKGQQS